MKVLLVGSGGREHALAWKLSQAPDLEELHAAPGNPGIAALGRCHPVRAEDSEGLLTLARSLEADLVVVGPEAPLVAGVANELRHVGVPVFGPSSGAAAIEGSKTFAKDVMRAAGVPTAESLSIARPPCVIKADGLAAGKGVFICHDQAELDAALQAASAFGDSIVIEELLEGEEISVFALCDGTRAVALPAVQDFKRAEDGDTGPNTGGMGSYSPVAGFGPAEVEEVLDTVHRPVLEELAARGVSFVASMATCWVRLYERRRAISRVSNSRSRTTQQSPSRSRPATIRPVTTWGRQSTGSRRPSRPARSSSMPAPPSTATDW